MICYRQCSRSSSSPIDFVREHPTITAKYIWSLSCRHRRRRHAHDAVVHSPGTVKLNGQVCKPGRGKDAPLIYIIHDNAGIRLRRQAPTFHTTIITALEWTLSLSNEINRSASISSRDALQPIVVEVEQNHFRLRRLQDEVAELLELHDRLERQLQLAPLYYNIREIQQVHLQRVQHPSPSHNDLLRLLFHR
eukprot:GHVU01163861.1.p1 GENE.GHVU01163861.1~~GHVU01163861.1.p1  ORF type:complete len:192 (+),score=5.86 GHVU01163861.1:226-801(+)